MCSSALNSRGKPAVSPMSGGPTFDMEKNQKRGKFKTLPRPTGKRSNKARSVVSLSNPVLLRMRDNILTRAAAFLYKSRAYF